MSTSTTNFGFIKPSIASAVDADIWGAQLNTNLDSSDSLIKIARDFVVASVETAVTVNITESNRNELVPLDTTSNNITVNLPTASSVGNGFMVALKKIDAVANTVTVDPSGSETIDLALTLLISIQNEAHLIVSDGTNWKIISSIGIPDKSITIPKLADQTQGDIIYYGSSGVAAILGAGTDGEFLQTKGSGSDPQWTKGGMSLIQTQTASTSANIDFTSFRNDTLYENYLIQISASTISVTGATLLLRTSTDGGSSYDAGTAYAYEESGRSMNNTAVAANSTAASGIQIVGPYNSQIDINADIQMRSPKESRRTTFVFESTYDDNSIGGGVLDGLVTVRGSGFNTNQQDTDAIRFIPSSGNIIDGEFSLYGFLK